MTQTSEPQSGTDTGLACLVMLARLHGRPADPAHLRHEFGAPGAAFGEAEILRAAKALGLKARAASRDWEGLQHTPLPAIAVGPGGSWFVVARVAEGRVLVQDPLASAPEALPREALEKRWSGGLILIGRSMGWAVPAGAFGFRWFVPALLKYRGLLGEVLVASFFLQLFALMTPLFFQVVIDKVLVHKGLTTLDVLAIGLLTVSLFEAFLGGLRTHLFAHTTTRVDVVLGAQLFAHVLRLPLAYFQSRRVGDTVARVRELESIRGFLTSSALTLVIDLLFTVVFFAVMLWYSPLLTAVVAGAIPLYVLLSVLVTPVLRARLEEKFSRGADSQAFLVESVNGIETLKSMAVEPQMQRRWEEYLAAYVTSAFRTTSLGNLANQSALFISKVTVVLILWIGARLVIEGSLTVGQLVAFNMLAARVSGPVLRLVQLWQEFQQAGVSVKRLGDILNAPAEPGYRSGRATPAGLTGRITFEHMGFRYRLDGPPVLEDISLDVPAGTLLGIVGRSGSGKSTLAKLVQRLYVPERGRVLVDGMDLALIDPSWLRRQIGVVPQESVLFNGTVRENIALADPGMPMAAVVRAAQIAGAHDFILGLAEGYDTRVGEHGDNLSGGQRQRIAIARALATDPRILIFDEATSALDYESERILQENLAGIRAGRTVLVIAHRLSTVRHADRIVVIEGGRLIEQGTHDALIEHHGEYARLHAYQSGGALWAVPR